MAEKIIVLDFGGQSNQLIVRRIRDLGVYSELVSYNADVSSYADVDLKGIVLTGGPTDVNAEDALLCPEEIFSLGVPVLGICYGAHLIARMKGGAVERAGVPEFGSTQFTPTHGNALLAGVEQGQVWMSHNLEVTKLPKGYRTVGETPSCKNAAFINEDDRIYAVQFHPEVTHTVYGEKLLSNFLYSICGCQGGWQVGSLADELIEGIRKQVGNSKIIAALSGGVDSTVAAVLAHKAIGGNMVCIFIDHGLLRLNEAQQVMQTYTKTLGLNIIHVDASERFLLRLKGVTDPEQKRKIIGEEFIRVFEEQARGIGADFLLQGTIYPDVIESGAGHSANIKSHHNVGGLPEHMDFKGLVEPLRMFFKDEVRRLGESIGIPHELVWRQPFPGPGLAIRLIGEITKERLDLLRHCDVIFREEVANFKLNEEIWQYFAALTGIKTVGVMGDERTYSEVVALRAVVTHDAMSVDFAELPWPLLHTVSRRITNEVKGINRVVYDVTSKPPATIEWE